MTDAPRVVLGVSGGIAAYKAVHLLRLLMDEGFYVTPVLSESTLRFVGEKTFSALASEKAKSSLFDDQLPSPHTSLGRESDVVVVAPATANTIAKLANGLSDDLLSATLLAARSTVVIAPAMHHEMWHNRGVQRNVAILRGDGVIVIDPTPGHLSGGDIGDGRMAEPTVIMAYIKSILSPYRVDLSGYRVLVTAGGTREPIDPVRYVGNRSSGKQGHAFATVARCLGAEVTLVSSAAESYDFPGVNVIPVERAQEMRDATIAHLDGSDIVIMTAAVADFRPGEVLDRKFKRGQDGELVVNFVPNPDILAEVVGAGMGRRVVVGFAAETNDAQENFRRKFSSKGVQVLVGNDVSAEGAGFGGASNTVTVLSERGEPQTLGPVDKSVIAQAVLHRISMEYLHKNEA